MKKLFEIEWPDELGENWMNKDNLGCCIVNTCRNTKGVDVREVTTITGLKEVGRTGKAVTVKFETDEDAQTCVLHIANLGGANSGGGACGSS